jgi:hypothetical protein
VRRERLALEAAVQFLDRWAATQAYQQSGREEDRQAALAALQRTIALRDALPDNLIVSGMQRAEARRQVQLLTGNRCEITQAGEWGFADDLNAGGMVRRDAEELTGFYLGTWGLGLPNGAEGTLVYRFTAKNGRHFTEAHLHALYLTRKEGLQTRIEVQKDDGPWQVFSENEGYSGWERQYPLTDLLAGATAFRVRFRARNGTGDSVLVLDNVGFGGKVE